VLPLDLRPEILGADTGHGEALAHFILAHYNSLAGDSSAPLRRGRRLPLLFLTGEQRRDVIPRTLTDPALDAGTRIAVDELVVYETGVMERFAEQFGREIARTAEAIVGGRLGETSAGHVGDDTQERRTTTTHEAAAAVVVVVFSPAGCQAMLRCLGYIDERGRLTERARQRAAAGDYNGDGVRYVVATIGPTTRDHLTREFGFEPDVCAERPSPEGVGEGLGRFLGGLNLNPVGGGRGEEQIDAMK